MKLLIFEMISTIFLFMVRPSQQQTIEVPYVYNQKEVYPNQMEPAVNTTNLEYANSTNPLFSHVLFEIDPKKQLSTEEFLQYIRFGSYRLTKGESELIFEFADGNKNGLVAMDEWDTFTNLYIFPFEACDENRDYLLDLKEFTKCFEKDPGSKYIIFRYGDVQTRHSQIMWALTTRALEVFNFYDYVFLRRALYAWKRCQSNPKYIAKNHFNCALRTALFQKLHFTVDYGIIYDTFLEMAGDRGLLELDFINYLKAMYSAFVFSTFGEPMNIPFLEKSQFLKAIREDRIPNNFREEEIVTIYNLINTNPISPNTQMNFPSFAYIYNLHRLFNKYAKQRPLQLLKEELLNLLEDVNAPQKVRFSIDLSSTNFTEAEYQEASLVLNRRRLNEGKYFYSFKQDVSESQANIWNSSAANNTYYNITKNVLAREAFFNIFSDFQTKEFWTKESFYKAFILSNLFTKFIPDTFVVSATVLTDRLLNMYETVNPPLTYLQKDNYPLYKFIPREVYVDILIFLTIENYSEKFKSVLKSSNKYVHESLAKFVLMDFGMSNMPDPVIDIAIRGYDSLKRRQYDTTQLIKNCVIVQAVASDNQRSNKWMKKFNLKVNLDNSRRFPNYPRRAAMTPWV